MTASPTPTTAPELTPAEQLAAAVVAATDPDELALTEAAMGPVDERNRPLVLALLTLLDSAGTLAEAIADNAIDTGKRVPDQASSLAGAAMIRMGRHLALAATWAESDALPALPQGHRLPTHLDACR
jgi:hypothetical protein